MAPEFVYPIKDVQNGLAEVRGPLSSRWLQAALTETGLAPVPGSSGEFDARLTMSGRDVVVRGTVRASLLMECGRCLASTPVTVCGELSLLLTPAKPPPGAPAAEGKGASAPKKGAKSRPAKRNRGDSREPDELELTAADASTDSYANDEVVLDGFLREAILLELPIFPLCSEECPGIGAVPPQAAPPAEAIPTIDPRLAPLLEFKKKKTP